MSQELLDSAKLLQEVKRATLEQQRKNTLLSRSLNELENVAHHAKEAVALVESCLRHTGVEVTTSLVGTLTDVEEKCRHTLACFSDHATSTKERATTDNKYRDFLEKRVEQLVGQCDQHQKNQNDLLHRFDQAQAMIRWMRTYVFTVMSERIAWREKCGSSNPAELASETLVIRRCQDLLRQSASSSPSTPTKQRANDASASSEMTDRPVSSSLKEVANELPNVSVVDTNDSIVERYLCRVEGHAAGGRGQHRTARHVSGLSELALLRELLQLGNMSDGVVDQVEAISAQLVQQRELHAQHLEAVRNACALSVHNMRSELCGVRAAAATLGTALRQEVAEVSEKIATTIHAMNLVPRVMVHAQQQRGTNKTAAPTKVEKKDATTQTTLPQAAFVTLEQRRRQSEETVSNAKVPSAPIVTQAAVRSVPEPAVPKQQRQQQQRSTEGVSHGTVVKKTMVESDPTSRQQGKMTQAPATKQSKQARGESSLAAPATKGATKMPARVSETATIASATPTTPAAASSSSSSSSSPSSSSSSSSSSPQEQEESNLSEEERIEEVEEEDVPVAVSSSSSSRPSLVVRKQAPQQQQDTAVSQDHYEKEEEVEEAVVVEKHKTIVPHPPSYSGAVQYAAGDEMTDDDHHFAPELPFSIDSANKETKAQQGAANWQQQLLLNPVAQLEAQTRRAGRLSDKVAKALQRVETLESGAKTLHRRRAESASGQKRLERELAVLGKAKTIAGGGADNSAACARPRPATGLTRIRCDHQVQRLPVEVAGDVASVDNCNTKQQRIHPGHDGSAATGESQTSSAKVQPKRQLDTAVFDDWIKDRVSQQYFS